MRSLEVLIYRAGGDAKNYHVSVPVGEAQKLGKLKFCTEKSDGRWVVPAKEEYLDEIIRVFNNECHIHLYGTKGEFIKTYVKKAEIRDDRAREIAFNRAMADFKEWLHRRNYSVSTIASYESLVGPFFRFFPKIHFRQITQANFEEFEEVNIKQRELSVAYKRQLVNALKRFWECYDYRFSFQCSQLELPSREEYVPDTLSEHDVRSLLACATDLRREMMLTLIYAFGLRSNELREIRLRDFSLGKKRLTLRAGTRGLRRVMFEENLKGKLHEYLVAYHPNVFLFESRPGTPYTQRRIQQICSEAGQVADLGKRVSPAVLRQSFGMHMLKNGARIETVQWLMGHRHIKSTERYVQAVR